MKYKGNVIAPPPPEIVAFPRENGDLVFVVKSVLDFSEFDALCPEPEPPSILKPGESASTPDFENPDYKKRVGTWYQNRLNWMCLEAIASPDISWDTVVPEQPETWSNFRVELRQDAGLTPQQVQHLVNRIMLHNSVDEKKMKEARDRFLTTRRPVAAASSSPADGQPST
jgi:hypothetical protein